MAARDSRSAVRALVVLLVVLAGCHPGRPADERGTGGRNHPTTARAALGDLRTLDPCTLIAPGDVRRLGPARHAGTVSLDYCLLHVRTNSETLVQLAVGELHSVDPAELTSGRPVARRAGLRVVSDRPVPRHCSRQILFADGIAMRISADQLAGKKPARACSVAEAGVRAVLRAVREGRVGHRGFPANSLALVDPCTLLDTEVVRRVPGLARAKAGSSPSRHRCRWGGDDPDEASVRLSHTAGRPPEPLYGTAVTERIAGRRTVVTIVGGDPSLPLCMVETGHIPFGGPDSGQVEVAQLVVSLPEGDGIRACRYARGLAERVWPRLPRA